MSRKHSVFSARYFFSPNTIFHALIYIVLCLFTTGCMEDSDSSNHSKDSSASTTRALAKGQLITVTGVAMKGALFNGVISLYSLEQHGYYVQIADQPLASTRTDRNGQYKLRVQLPPQSMGIAIRLTADPYTTMICDVPAGCINPSSQKIAFGAATAVQSGFEMYSVSAAKQGNIEIHITPLTHLAYKWAEAQSTGLSPNNIAIAHSHIENLFNLPANALAKMPANITALGTDTSYSQEQIQHGLLAASFQALADASQWEGIIDLLNAAGTRIAETGTLPKVNLGVLPEVTRSDLFYAAQNIAAEVADYLSQTQPKNTKSKQTVPTLKQLAQSYGDIANRLLTTSYDEEPLRITFQPSSTTIYAGESVTLSVNALGTGPIRYQWRKDGQPIPQATHEHFTLTNSSLQDSGYYDCVVANDDGRIISQAALVTIKSHRTPVLVWAPPTVRLDGSPLHLSELKGYRILYGLKQQQLDHKIEIPDPYTTHFELSGLQGSTYYFAIQAIDELGNESSLSSVIKVTL